MCRNRLRRLTLILQETEAQRKPFQHLRRMRDWLIEIERILALDWAVTPEEVTQAAVDQRLDAWQTRLEAHLQTGGEHPEEVRCLSYVLKVVTDLRPWLTHCYAVADLPRTNNEMELLIRSLKTGYRRISGRKNWNTYLLRYGRCVAYYECWSSQPECLENRLRQASPQEWRRVRKESRLSQRQQLNRYHFRHQRQECLAALEAQWEQACWMGVLPPRFKKSSRHLLTRVTMKDQFIAEHRQQYPISTMCRVLGVSVSGFYA